ncbi:hypothetical protein JYU34_019347 [Plutella xylostella]|uniref:Cytochrome P450 n=1 Tax=Plutella xylostella TaxID=51655 RepID=A0ABQ7PWM1_PLUXY|nr:hypothetical protein JYU34_019347 [Plutella xylostella]
MWLLLTLSAFSAIAFVLLRLLAYFRYVKKCSLIPTLGDSLPVIGHAHHLIIKDTVEIVDFIAGKCRESNQVGGVSKIWIGPYPLMLITDPDDALTVANTCYQKPYVYKFADAWVGDGLATALLTTTWRKHRKLLNPSFSQQCLNGFLQIFNEQAAALARDLAPHAGGGPFDHNRYIMSNAFDGICKTTFGKPDGILDKGSSTEDYKKAVDTIVHVCMQRILTLWMHFDVVFKFSKLRAEEEKAVKTLRGTSWDALKKTQSAVGQENKKLDDRFQPFINSLIDLIADGSMTEKEIQEELDTLIFAGHDTSATQLLYVLMAIGSYPDVQEKIYKELQEVFGDSTRDVTKDDFRRLEYLEAVLKEVMRLYPIAPIILRDIDQDVKCKNVTIPSGSTAFIGLWGVNRSGAWGADADQFDPGRWLEPARLPASPAAFASFSIGKRGCIGKTYAMMSMKTTLVHLLRRYRLKADISKLQVQLVLMLKPVSGCEISIESRDAEKKCN